MEDSRDVAYPTTGYVKGCEMWNALDLGKRLFEVGPGTSQG